MKFGPQEFSVTFKTGGDLTMGMSLINTYAFFLVPWTLHLLFINEASKKTFSVNNLWLFEKCPPFTEFWFSDSGCL